MLLILRVSVALLMLAHGIPKLNTLLAGGPVEFADPIGVGETASLVLAVFAEVLCSLLLLLGMAVRLATVPLIITMLIAVFIVHAKDGLEQQEQGLQYLLAYLVLLFAGGGAISIDKLISRNNIRSRRGY